MYSELPLEVIDTVIKAELPYGEEYPSRRDIVLKYNMHCSNHLVYPTNAALKMGSVCMVSLTL